MDQPETGMMLITVQIHTDDNRLAGGDTIDVRDKPIVQISYNSHCLISRS